jgi:hypothetical protein
MITCQECAYWKQVCADRGECRVILSSLRGKLREAEDGCIHGVRKEDIHNLKE